jgi:hypothetical protein
MVVNRWNLRVRKSTRNLELLPKEDNALGESIMGRLGEISRSKGLPRSALVALFPDEVEQFDLATVRKAPEPHRTRLTASILGRPELECGVLAGTMMVNRRGQPPIRGLVVYIEWPDNRWWTSWQPLSDGHMPTSSDPVVRRAIDGWPMPRGVGGWFSRVRREGLNLRVHQPTPVAQPGLDLVH